MSITSVKCGLFHPLFLPFSFFTFNFRKRRSQCNFLSVCAGDLNLCFLRAVNAAVDDPLEVADIQTATRKQARNVPEEKDA
jgi:hypothetical protein